MPTYEYLCKSCGHLFEIVRSMRDDPLTECPQCGGELRKVFAPPAIAFKGSGFYATDHGKKSKKPGEKGESGEKKSDDTAARTSESKSEGKKDGTARAAADRRRSRRTRSDPSGSSQGEVLDMTTAEIGVFGGSGFYSFLSEVETVDIDTPYGPPSAPPVIGDVGGRRVAFIPRHGLQARVPSAPRSRIAPTCGP